MRPSPHTPIVTLALACLIVLAPSLATAQPDFAQSTLTHEPARVSEGDVVTFTAAVRNGGTEGAPYAEVDIGLPLEAMFVDAEGLEAAEVDAVAKQLFVTADLAAGAERRISFRMVVPRDAGGHTLAAMLRVRYPYRSVEFVTNDSVDVETRIAEGWLTIGGVQLGSAELTLLAIVALYPALWFALPRRSRSHGIVFPIVLAVAFWTMFAALAWRDWSTLSSWREASCTVHDTRMREATASSSIAPGRSPPRSPNRQLKPLLALGYTAGDAAVISTGYETGSRVMIGRGRALVEEYAGWSIGSTVPCWFDPRNPRDVVVIRGFGGAYFFALIPVPVFALGVLGLRRRRRSHR